MHDFTLSLIFVTLISLLTACADPKYVQSEATGPEKGTKSFETCVADFAPGPGCVAYRWEKLPVGKEYGSFLLKIGRRNKADDTILPEDPVQQVFVQLWMPSMGHPSSPVKLERLDRGTYRVHRVYFVHGGDWEIQVQLKDGDAVLNQANIPLNI